MQWTPLPCLAYDLSLERDGAEIPVHKEEGHVLRDLGGRRFAGHMELRWCDAQQQSEGV